jgi:K+-transporting ATPase ATPase C chain
MRRQLLTGVIAMLVFTVICGVLYPLAVTVIAQVGFSDAANGQLVRVDGEIVGARNIGQTFTEPQYFQTRPAAAGALAAGSLGADGAPVPFDDLTQAASGGSNLGPTNPDLLALVEERVAAYRAANGLSDDVAVPVDAVTSSGSGVDPHISIANARLQAARVADERGVSLKVANRMIDDHIDEAALGFLGVPGVNVLELNLALDRATASDS